MTKEQFLSFDLEKQVNIWNNFSYENSFGIQIHNNDKFTINDLYYDNAYKLVLDIHYGQYDYNERYFYYDDLGYLISFSDEMTFSYLIDIDEMITWYNNTYKGEE